MPSGSRLWYDDRDIPFLREDLKDEAEIKRTDAVTIKTLIDAGYKEDAAVEYVRTGNLSVLIGEHTGRVPVQLLPKGEEADEDSDTEPDESGDAGNNGAEPVGVPG